MRSLLILLATGAVCCGSRTEHRTARALTPCPAIPSEELRLWLRADAGLESDAQRRVKTWLDQSPEQNDFSQPVPERQPVWDISRGRAVIRFLNPAAFLTNATLTGPMNEFTAVVVLAPLNLDGTGEYLNAGGWSQFVFARGTGGTVMAGTSPAARLDTRPLMKKYERQRYVFVSRGGTASLFLNGHEIATRTSEPASPWSGLRIGGTDEHLGLRGDVAELLIYRRALSSQEVARLDAYLTAKYWNLPGCVCPDGRGPHPERRPEGRT
jgi:hypothetical protein